MQVALEVILSGLATGRGLLVMRSAKQIAATLQALSDMGIDTKTLIDSGRMTTVTNTFYYEVSTYQFHQLTGKKRIVRQKNVENFHLLFVKKLFVVLVVLKSMLLEKSHIYLQTKSLLLNLKLGCNNK